MTPAERAFWQRVNRRAAGLSPEIAAVLLRAFEVLRQRVGDTLVQQMIETGNVELLFRAALSEPVLEAAFAPVRERIYRTTSDAVPYFARDLPRGGRIGGQIAIAFNVLRPQVLDAIRALDTKVIQGLKDEVRATVRQVVDRGLREGVNPRAMARDLRAAVGLAPNQERAVANFRAALEDGKVAKALGYELRDRRFDATIKKGPLTPAQVEKMAEAYRRRFIAHNAETHARTAALDAQKLAQRAVWDDAIVKGIVDRGELYKRWIGVLDTRERPEHLAMEGDTVPFDQPFLNGEQVPGESTYNCFAADTPVEGTFVGGLKARYSGPMREIHTARGYRLCLTPNHPVLTAKGWVPAHALREGMALVCDARHVNGGSANGDDVHHQHSPSSIEQVFHSLAANGASATRPVGRLDLHGDAEFVDSDIHVVYADARLMVEAGVTGDDGLDDRPFVLADMHKAVAPGAGALDADLDGITLTPARALGSADLTGDVSGAVLDPLPLQALRVGPASNWHTTLGEPSKQDDAIVAGFIRELLEASAGLVALDDLVKIRDVDASGHVYDLQAVDGWILAGGIVSSNCRCIVRYMVRPNGPPVETAADRAARAKAERLLVLAGGDATVPF